MIAAMCYDLRIAELRSMTEIVVECCLNGYFVIDLMEYDD